MTETNHADDFDGALAHISILCTCTAWTLWIVLPLILGPQLPIVWRLLAILRFLLIVFGLSLSLICVFDVQTPQAAGTRRAAWIGLVLSSGTLLWIVLLFLRFALGSRPGIA